MFNVKHAKENFRNIFSPLLETHVKIIIDMLYINKHAIYIIDKHANFIAINYNLTKIEKKR